MTYSTGTGDYIALMAAVLAHAVADGWTTTSGNWPISKGIVRGVDWSTYTATEVDRTLLGGATKTVRYLRIAVGTSPSDATTNAGANASSAQAANMNYTFTSWHIFSDPTVSDYIHVVCNFSNGIHSDCYTHFGFGALDKHGMTHTGIVYATASPKRAYSIDTSNGISALDWNGGPYGRINQFYTGRSLFTFIPTYYGQNGLVYIIDPTVNPLPSSGWPAANVVQGPDNVVNTISPDTHAQAKQDPSERSLGYEYNWSTWAQFTTPQPYSGAMTMGPLPVWILQNSGPSSKVTYVGSFPNVRTCSLELYSPKDILTYGAEEWMVFPMLRSTAWSLTHLTDQITSGRSGYAFKKVP